MSQAVLTLSGISKRFGQQQVIDGLSLTVNEGDVYGFLGPNGAGKTTTIRMIFGLIRPSAGEINVAGRSVTRERLAALPHLGGIIEYPVFPGYLTAREFLRYMGTLSGGVRSERIDEVLELVQLTTAAEKLVRTFSLGMRQRLGIAQAILARPKLIVLDEPTNGLDPAGIIEVRTLIQGLAKSQGVSVFVSSHQLHEVQLVCNRVGILNRGRLVAEGEVGQLLQQDTLQVVIQAHDTAKAAAVLGSEPWVKQVAPGFGDQIVVTVDRGRAGELNRYLMERGVIVQAVKPKELSLEDLFIQLTGGENNAAASSLGTG